jgi:hypothetical protein
LAEASNHAGMIIRVALALLSAVVFCSSSSGEEVSVQMTGIGSTTCAYWQSSKARRAEGTVWIYGFWTGLNYVAAASEQAQSNASETAMVAAVEKACARRPSEVLASAAWAAYLEAGKKK